MFYSGLIIFFGIHLVPLFRKLRVFLKEKLGEGPYMGLFSAVTLAGILLIIFGYESNSNFLYAVNGKAYIYANYIMFFSLTLFIAANLPTYIKKYTKHPMSLGIAIWTVLHLMTNSDTTSVILFGSFLAYSSLSVIVAELRDLESKEVIPKIHYDMLSIVLGALLTFLAFNFHEYLSGISLS